MNRILDGTFGKKEKVKTQSVKLNPKFISRYFNGTQSQQEITNYVETAVAFYSDYLKQLAVQARATSIQVNDEPRYSRNDLFSERTVCLTRQKEG